MTEITLETKRTWSTRCYGSCWCKEPPQYPGLSTIVRRMKKLGQKMVKSVANGDGSYTMTFVDRETGL